MITVRVSLTLTLTRTLTLALALALTLTLTLTLTLALALTLTLTLPLPLTQEIMEDPVTTSDGHAYERREIFRWLCTHNTSPLTGSVLPNKFLTPALALRQLIAAFKAEHPDVVDSLV